MKSVLLAQMGIGVLSVAGCATATTTAVRDTSAADVAPGRTPPRPDVASRVADTAAEERVRELESLLALRTAEARDLRREMDAREAEARAAAERTATVRIGPRADAERDAPSFAEELGATEAVDDHAVRPVLRLYGEPSMPFGAAPRAPAPPVDLPPTLAALPALPVVPVAASDVPPIPIVPGTIAPMPAAGPDPTVIGQERYREALAMIAARRFSDADRALTHFLATHATHPYVPHARYWLGEARYGARDYAGARAALDAFVSSYPAERRVPDALLKLALCLRHLGDDAGARAAFRRLIAQFPDSGAARLASREDRS